MNYTKKQKLFYTIIVCALMEFIMAFYNLFFHTDAFLHEAFYLACIEFLPAFVLGFLMEWYCISKPAKSLAKYLHKHHFKDRDIIHINEFLIAFGMMMVISIYGALLHTKQFELFNTLILIDFIKNASVGIPIYIFIVSPWTRHLIKKYHI